MDFCPRLIPLFATVAAVLLCMGTTEAAEADLAHAEHLIREQQYAAAYDLLAPSQQQMGDDPTYNYLLGRAALGAHQPEIARERLEQSVAARPGFFPARLALGRAYYALGRYADAQIEFDTVLQFGDNLPADLKSQTQIYAAAADDYLQEGARLIGFDYAEAGLGQYHINSTSGDNPVDRNHPFYMVTLAGALSYLFDSGYSLDGSLAYEARVYDARDTRNDSDLTWRAGIGRALGESNVELGVRGLVSYVGDGDYRNDYGVFADWNHGVTAQDELALAVHVRRRQYPHGPLRERSRTISELNAEWIHSFLEGHASLSLAAHGGYQRASSRPDGDSWFYGVTAALDYTFRQSLGAFVFAWWEHDRFNADNLRVHPDALDEATILRRRDDLYELGAGLVWEFASTWTLEPEVLYARDESNVEDFHYSSTEIWATLRKVF